MATPLECIACFKPVPNDGRFMKCSECQHVYHLGQSCAGIADSTFTTMGSLKREKWRCRTCRTKECRGSTSINSQEDSSVVLVQLTALNEKIDSLMSIKDSVETLLNLPTKVDELMALKPTVERLQSTVEEVQSAISFLSSKYDVLMLTVSANEKKMKELDAESAILRATVSEQSVAIKKLQDEANDAEQYSRQMNMEISGLPVSNNENLSNEVCDLARKLGLNDFHAPDILAIHRLPSRKGAIPVVLVRFASLRIRDRWMDARGKLRSLAGSGTVPRIFLNENLTRANKELFWLARSRGKEKGYKFVWVRGGKIFAKKLEGAPLVRIFCSSDVDKII